GDVAPRAVAEPAQRREGRGPVRGRAAAGAAPAGAPGRREPDAARPAGSVAGGPADALARRLRAQPRPARGRRGAAAGLRARGGPAPPAQPELAVLHPGAVAVGAAGRGRGARAHRRPRRLLSQAEGSSSTPAAAISSRALAPCSGVTGTVRSVSTRTRRPSAAASSAVCL